MKMAELWVCSRGAMWTAHSAINSKPAAGMLMETGSVSVTPQDTSSTLQEVMASSGWGQVPVIDPESDEIIGIVTRTDLISTHSGQNNLPSPEIIQLLQRMPFHTTPGIAARNWQGRHTLEHAGIHRGRFVRDLLLRRLQPRSGYCRRRRCHRFCKRAGAALWRAGCGAPAFWHC